MVELAELCEECVGVGWMGGGCDSLYSVIIRAMPVAMIRSDDRFMTW